MNRLQVLEKRAEIAQIKEVINLQSTPLLRHVLDNKLNENDLWDDLIRAEDDLTEVQLYLIKKGAV